MIIDRFLAVADIVESRHILVDAPPDVTREALRRLDFANTPGLLMRVMMKLGLRAINRARRRLGKAPVQGKLTLENIEQLGRIRLADEPREIVIGAIERPGKMESLFEHRTPQQFAAFNCPGHIKAVASFQIEPHGKKQTLITYETRIRATDTATRRKLFLMDRLLMPLSKIAMKSTLEFIKNSVERACAARKARTEKVSNP